LLGQTAEGLQFLRPDIVASALGKPIDKHRQRRPAKQHNGPETTRLALALPGDPLLDDAAAEIGIDPPDISMVKTYFPCG
jgi:hypothetical protein